MYDVRQQSSSYVRAQFMLKFDVTRHMHLCISAESYACGSRTIPNSMWSPQLLYTNMHEHGHNASAYIGLVTDKALGMVMQSSCVSLNFANSGLTCSATTVVQNLTCFHALTCSWGVKCCCLSRLTRHLANELQYSHL